MPLVGFKKNSHSPCPPFGRVTALLRLQPLDRLPPATSRPILPVRMARTLTRYDRWGAVRGSRKRDTPLHCPEKMKVRRGPPVPHRNPEIRHPKRYPRPSSDCGFVQAGIPLPFGFDFSIAAVPPCPRREARSSSCGFQIR
jgi:hypothetical protein